MKNSFLARILITYVIIVFSLIFIIFIGYYIYIQNEAQKRIEESDSASFLTYVGNCEELFETINYIAGAVRTINSLDRFAYSSKEDYYVRLTELYNDMSMLNQRLAERQCKVVVHKINDSTAVSSLSTITIPALVSEFGISPATYKDIISGLSDTPLYGGHYVFTDRSIIYITSKSYVDNKMIILVIIDAARIVMKTPDEDMTVSFTPEGRSVTDLRTKASNIPVKLESDASMTSGTLYTKKQDNLTYKWVKSRFLSLNYFYFTNSSMINKKMIVTMANMLFILLGVCVLAFVVILFFSIRLYKPIERLINTFMSFDVNGKLSKSSINDIDYIAQQVCNIRSSNQELVKKVEDSNKYIMDKLIFEILMGSYNPTTVDAELKRLSLDWLCEECFVIAFELSDVNNEMLVKSPALLDNVVKVIREQIGSDFRCENILLNQDTPCFVVNCSSISILKDRLNEIVAVIDTAFGLLLSAYIGNMSEGLDGLRTSFITGNRLLENKNLISIKNVYDYRDIKELPVNLVVYPLNNEMQLINAVEKNNSHEVKRLINYIFAEYVDKAFINKEYRDLIIFALANTINRSMQKAGIQLSSVSEEGKILYLELKMCKDSHMLLSLIHI